jgi:hypothetical protein
MGNPFWEHGVASGRTRRAGLKKLHTKQIISSKPRKRRRAERKRNPENKIKIKLIKLIKSVFSL